jgi:lon-related putative ATP-dependent protease
VTLQFQTTDELPRLEQVIGQPRAFRALELGSAVTGLGYNIFAVGLPNSGRTNLIRQYLERLAETAPVPDDWCYVNNFSHDHEPKAIRLPAGRGKELHTDMQALIERCEHEIPRAFESEGYIRERDRVISDLKNKEESEFNRITELTAKYGFVLTKSPFGFVLAPAIEGKALEPEQIDKLAPEQLAKLEKIEETLQEKVTESLLRIRDMTSEAHEAIQKLNSRTVLFVVGSLIEALKNKYAGVDRVIAYLDAVKDDLVANGQRFRPKDNSNQKELASGDMNWEQRYSVNLLVDNSQTRGAPVIVENQPTYNNLLGRIEHEIVLGATQTDFTMIRPGAVHRANGGYLVLPARDVLLNSYAWEGLKHVLRDAAIRIVELGTQLSLLSTTTLEPEPIPLSLKVVLIGTPLLYYLINAYDEDFAKLFKVKAEFATDMDRTPDTEREYALFVKSVVDENHLPAFDNTAVASIIDYGSRLAGDQAKLSTRFGMVADLIRETSYWASKENHATITATAVDRATEEAIYRNNLLQERLQEMVNNGTLMIDVTSTVAGQINALSVLTLGDYSFGHPSRVTASARPGQGGIVDIERKAELGGPIHTKAVLIISGFLGERYGQKQPLSLSSSLAFEQSYEGVEGDSASAAEVLALLSAISGIPLRQDLAITGSMNQHGQIQAIGGVNEKIEGFFAICRQRGLTGTQGVIIPASNGRNLMLKEEVVKAVQAGDFHIWAISTLDEAIALLTNTVPGESQEDGAYPEGSFNHAVMTRLTEFAQVLERSKKKEEKNDSEDESAIV